MLFYSKKIVNILTYFFLYFVSVKHVFTAHFYITTLSRTEDIILILFCLIAILFIFLNNLQHIYHKH